MIVITLTKVPRSLRGDLTKWFQEVQTGVYVGSVSARIRDRVWERVQQNIGGGQATMVYTAQNELGYQFKTSRTDYDVVDFDGVPLMKHLNVEPAQREPGFSRAAKYQKARKFARQSQKADKKVVSQPFVALDVETTGLDASTDEIISIGAIKSDGVSETEMFERLVSIDRGVPDSIAQLTGITGMDLIERGVDLSAAFSELATFVGDLPIVGYNIRFDDGFLLAAAHSVNLPELPNQMIDLIPLVKKANRFMDNYRLNTVLELYKIKNEHAHNSTSDARATMYLALKLMKNGARVF